MVERIIALMIMRMKIIFRQRLCPGVFSKLVQLILDGMSVTPTLIQCLFLSLYRVLICSLMDQQQRQHTRKHVYRHSC